MTQEVGEGQGPPLQEGSCRLRGGGHRTTHAVPSQGGWGPVCSQHPPVSAGGRGLFGSSLGPITLVLGVATLVPTPSLAPGVHGGLRLDPWKRGLPGLQTRASGGSTAQSRKRNGIRRISWGCGDRQLSFLLVLETSSRGPGAPCHRVGPQSESNGEKQSREVQKGR